MTRTRTYTKALMENAKRFMDGLPALPPPLHNIPRRKIRSRTRRDMELMAAPLAKQRLP